MTKSSEYKRVMEGSGFYYAGKPIPTLIEADSSVGQRELFRYRPLFESAKAHTVSVYELSGAPCIYFSQLADADPSATQLRELRRAAWNRGTAPLLWVITPAKVLIYNAYARPDRDEEVDDRTNLIRAFEQTEEGLRALNAFAGRLEIETGRFWQRREAKSIDRYYRVDASLLRDLSDADVQLRRKRLPKAISHALLGRSIFVAYLQDREILKPQYFRLHYGVENFTELLASKSKTYQLFRWVRRTFNGDLFPLTRKRKQTSDSGRVLREEDIVRPEHLDVIQSLMMGTEIATGQGRLWPYDFSIIPVELISSIYENFAYTGGARTARRRSTHYTPFPLVDLVLSQVLETIAVDTKTIDLACGSGVFLVETFRRLVSKRVADGQELTRKLIRDTLHDQIFGIDINKEAVQLAAFSLYLTALELDPKPQPPSALKFKRLIGENLFAGDAFDEAAHFNSKDVFVQRSFGAVVGNPPWRSGRKTEHKLLLEYCKKRSLPLARNTPDQAFLWRAADVTEKGATVGLILHGKPFFARTKSALAAKKALLTKLRPRLLINLADLRLEKLFPHSQAAALIYIGENLRAEPEDMLVLAAPKRKERVKKHGMIQITSDQIKSLRVLQVASDPDLLKVASWGSARDFAFIQRLRTSYPVLEEFIKEKGCNAGQGFQVASRTSQTPEEYLDMKVLPPKHLKSFEIDVAALPRLQLDTLHRPRRPEIYKAPLVITTRGLTLNGFAAAFSGADLLYSESYYGIAFPPKEVRHAHFLNGVLNSSLINYFLFLTSTVWGVERDEVRREDVLRLPLTWRDESLVELIVGLEGQLRVTTEPQETHRLKHSLDEAVFNLFEVNGTERTLIGDMIDFTLDLKIRRGASQAVKRPSINDLRSYARQTMSVIQPFLQTLNGQVMKATVFDTGAGPLSVVKFSSVASGQLSEILEHRSNDNDISALLASIANEMPQRIAECVYTQPNLRIYAGETLYVVRPSQRQFWTQAAALSDADAILAEHLEEENGSNYLEPTLAGWPPSVNQAAHTA
jgi:hypothetical protein